MTAEEIAAGLMELERERITGWQGPAGAAYNVISEDLCEAGLLNSDWSLSPLGMQVRAILESNHDRATRQDAPVTEISDDQ